MQYEIFFYNLQGEFKKIRGLFNIEERRIVMEALQKSNYTAPFFTALYSTPMGQFGQAWTYADEIPAPLKKSEAPEAATSRASSPSKSLAKVDYERTVA